MIEQVFEILCRPITDRLEKLMATVEELQAQVTETKDALQAAIDRVAADVEALRDKVAAGIDPSELDPIAEGLAQVKETLDALDPDPANPPAEPA